MWDRREIVGAVKEFERLAALREIGGHPGVPMTMGDNPPPEPPKSAQPKGTVNGERKLFTGGAADYVGDIRALAEVGVTSFDFGLFGPTLAATLDNMRRFRDEVMVKVK